MVAIKLVSTFKEIFFGFNRMRSKIQKSFSEDSRSQMN